MKEGECARASFFSLSAMNCSFCLQFLGVLKQRCSSNILGIPERFICCEDVANLFRHYQYDEEWIAQHRHRPLPWLCYDYWKDRSRFVPIPYVETEEPTSWEEDDDDD
jgi:hypothetical protein